MINTSIESFKLPFKNEKKNFHYVIHKDAFLSKGTYNEEMESHFFHHRDTV